jgi:hypothetical protein
MSQPNVDSCCGISGPARFDSEQISSDKDLSRLNVGDLPNLRIRFVKRWA